MLKAIETTYKNCKFRSRLEARWAVFLDTLGIKWDYEPEGFELGGGLRYLPDFWLPEYKIWIEVKPSGPMSSLDKQKVLGLTQLGDAPVYVTHGKPGDLGVLHYTKRSMFGEVNDRECPAVLDWDYKPSGNLCIRVPIQHSCEESDYAGSPFFFKESSLGFGNDEEDSQVYWEGMGDAVAAACGARFEFGQSGASL